jgi:hypothetical protein
MANFVKKEIPQDKRIILLNRDKQENAITDLYTTPVISALSMHAVYYEPEVLDFIGIDKVLTKRKNTIDQIQKITYTCDAGSEADKKISAIMKVTNNQYILAFKNTSCFDKLGSFTVVHKEGELGLYKLL